MRKKAVALLWYTGFGLLLATVLSLPLAAQNAPTPPRTSYPAPTPEEEKEIAALLSKLSPSAELIQEAQEMEKTERLWAAFESAADLIRQAPPAKKKEYEEKLKKYKEIQGKWRAFDKERVKTAAKLKTFQHKMVPLVTSYLEGLLPNEKGQKAPAERSPETQTAPKVEESKGTDLLLVDILTAVPKDTRTHTVIKNWLSNKPLTEPLDNAEILKRIASMKIAGIVPVLEKAIYKASFTNRNHLLTTLRYVSESTPKNLTPAINVILKYMKSPNPTNFPNALNILALCMRSKEVDESYRREIMSKVLEIGETGSTRDLGLVIQYLGKFPTEESAKMLNPFLSHATQSVVAQTIQSLGNIGNPAKETTTTLVNFLKAEHPLSLRMATLNALGKIKNLETVPHIIPLLTDEKTQIQTSSYKALVNITGKNLSVNILAWQVWWEEYLKKQEKQEGS